MNQSGNWGGQLEKRGNDQASQNHSICSSKCVSGALCPEVQFNINMPQLPQRNAHNATGKQNLVSTLFLLAKQPH